MVFEAVDVSTNTWTTIRLVLRPEALFSEPQRIVYERVYPCSPTKHSFVTFIDSNFSFGGDPEDSPYLPELPTLIEHTIRIVPIFESRSPFQHLPRRVLRRIVQCTFEYKNKGWRKNLLTIALVCKGWSHVLDLFFRGPVPDNDAPDIFAFARSLEMRPDRMRLIQEFDTQAFHFPTPKGIDEAKELKRSQIFVTVLQQATLLEKVRLRGIRAPHVSAAVDALSQLREMKSLTMDGYYSRSELDKFTMSDLQWAISGSKHLRHFHAEGWRDSSDTE